jgi:hypothetical protein
MGSVSGGRAPDGVGCAGIILGSALQYFFCVLQLSLTQSLQI